MKHETIDTDPIEFKESKHIWWDYVPQLWYKGH